MGNYISITDIESITGVTYNTTTSPTLAQMNQYITSGEAQFERDCGVRYTTTFTDEVVDGYSFGLWLKNHTPLNSITKIETHDGNYFSPTWSESDVDFIIADADIGKVELAIPIMGKRVYRVSGTSGYATETMPQYIKDLVILYVFRQIFQLEFFNKKGANVTETIDVKVYKEVTNGGSLANGVRDLDLLIEERKADLDNRLKTYLL